jgi:hypothetical protein
MKTKMYAAMAATAMLALPTSTASAANPHPVDPATVTPGLSPDFDPWYCFTSGQGITCQGSAEETYDLDIELECDGAVVHVAGGERAGMTRWHDADGRALKSEVRRSFADRLTLAGAEEPAVHLVAHEARHYVYPVPGDASQRVLRETGAVVVLRAEGGGVLFRVTGQLAYAPGDEDAPETIHGSFDSWAGVETLDEAICRGLTG